MSDGTRPAETKEVRSGISGIPLAVAVVAVLTWLAFVIVMLRSTGQGETEWTRLTFVFASVEAIAFAAAGALFGVTVQRERVQAAEEKAATNERDAANGRALAIANMSDGGHLVASDTDSEVESYGPDSPEDGIRVRHAELARKLFPDLP